MFSRYDVLTLIGLCLLAAGLRLLPVGVNSFASDEARVSLLALQTARGEQFARFGIASSAGARNLPASIYAFVPPYFISSDALLATWYVALLNILSVVGVWGGVRRCYGRWAAFLAALWLAANPFAVVFSRNIWTQNLLVPLATLWLITAFFATTTDKSRLRFALIMLNIFIAGVAFQVHLAGLSLIPAALVVFLRFRWWRCFLPVIIGGVLALLPLVPFLYHAACCAPELINEYRAAAGGGDSAIDAQSLLFTLRIAVGYDWAYMADGEWNSGAASVPLAVLAGVIAMGGVAGSFLPHPSTPSPNMERGSRNPANSTKILAELALILLIATVITFAYHSTPVRLHYQLGALPAVAVFIGRGASFFLSARPLIHTQTTPTPALVSHRKALRFARGGISNFPTYIGGVSGVFIVLIALIWSVQLIAAFTQIQAKVAPGGIGSLLKAPYQVVQAIPHDAPVLVHTVSDDVTTRGEPATWAVLLWEREHRVIDGWSVLILPPEPAYILSEEASIPAWEELDAAGLIQASRYFYPVEGMPSYYLTQYDGVSQPEGFTLLATPIPFENGLTLLGWKARQLPDRLRLSTMYHIDSLPEPGMYRQFTHLRDAAMLDAEHPVLIADVPLSSQNWRAGDTLIVMADFFPTAPGEFWFDVGQYAADRFGRFARRDGQGDSVRIGSFMGQ